MTSTKQPMHFAPHHVPTTPLSALRGFPAGMLAAALFVGLAFASPAQAADAAALLKEAKKLYAAKKYDEACPKYAESYAQSANVATLVDLALCHEKQGKLATAFNELLEAETEARKAGKSYIEQRARANGRTLEPKLPRVKVTIASPVDGMEVMIDGEKISISAQGKGRPVDPGEHKITASAPGRKPWESSFTVKKAEKKSIAVPALAEAPADKPPPTDKPDTTSGGGESTDKPKGETDKPKEPEKKPEEDNGPPVHPAGRIVLDVSALGGGQLFLGGGYTQTMASLTYEYRIVDQSGFDASALGVCDASTCRATIDPAIGIPVGGQAFVGYAVRDDLHFGGRFFGSYMPTGGFSLLAGPAISKRIGDSLWLGGTVVIGIGNQDAPIVGAKGLVPSEWVERNGTDEVDVPLDRSIPERDLVSYGFAFGAAVEVSYRLTEFGKGKRFATGSLLLNAWPTFLKTGDGFAVALPLGIGVRFH